MPAKILDLKVITFKSHGDATSHFQTMLRGYRPLDRVNTADAEHLLELIKRHPEYEQKLGCGIDHFEVESADYGTQCFVVVRTDNSRERFSYPECIIGRKF